MHFTNEQIKQNREDWKAALRSGEYKQGEGSLCVDDRYCCLGVACEVLKTKLSLVVGKDAYDPGVRTYNGLDTYLPPEVADALGLCSDTGCHRLGLSVGSLVLLNDSGTTFEEIADLLDESNSPYFKELT